MGNFSKYCLLALVSMSLAAGCSSPGVVLPVDNSRVSFLQPPQKTAFKVGEACSDLGMRLESALVDRVVCSGGRLEPKASGFALRVDFAISASPGGGSDVSFVATGKGAEGLGPWPDPWASVEIERALMARGASPARLLGR